MKKHIKIISVVAVVLLLAVIVPIAVLCDNKKGVVEKGGGEGMTKRSDFIYNKEADLVLVDYNCAGLNYDEYVELFYNLREK